MNRRDFLKCTVAGADLPPENWTNLKESPLGSEALPITGKTGLTKLAKQNLEEVASKQQYAAIA